MIRPFRSVRPAFTLVELSISLAILGVILVSLGSVLVLAAKALPSSSTSAAGGITAQGALDQLMSDVRFATSISESTPTTLAFTVADRDRNGTPEAIKYSWSGVAGGPLLRQYNGGAATPVIPAVSSLALGYVKQKHTQSSVTTTTSDSGEVLFSSFSGWGAILTTQTTGNVSTTSWSAELFSIDRVSIPADSTKIAITRVTLKLKKPASGTAGCTVGIYPPSAAGSSIPGTSPIGTPYSVSAAELKTTFDWVDATFSDVVIPPSQTEFIIVVKGVAATTSASLQYLNSLLAPLDASVYRYTTNSGSSWQPALSVLSTNDGYYSVYGTYQRQTTATANVDTYTLSALTASLQPSGGGSPRFDTSIETLNDPAIAGP